VYNYIEALDGVLMRINEKIHIDEHNPEWVRQYEYEKEQLCNALGDYDRQEKHEPVAGKKLSH
jgi:GrpB-like predicted nucleotidyltransferase (UPF0157 family)